MPQKQNRVFVLDKEKNPLMPCSPGRARRMLRAGSAAVFRKAPFTIILKDRVGGETQPVSVKIDPGSKTTGIVLVADFPSRGPIVVFASEIDHRGPQIKKKMDQRRAFRRRRRSTLRYRKPRFDNRKKPAGGLPPSLRHRVETTASWIDAACVGESGTTICLDPDLVPLRIRAMGHGTRQVARTDRYGFPIRLCPRDKTVFGFRTGDRIRAMVPSGKKSGTHVGRVAVRSSGSFNVRTAAGLVQGISHKHCRLIQRADGYGYSLERKGEGAFLPGVNAEVSNARQG